MWRLEETLTQNLLLLQALDSIVRPQIVACLVYADGIVSWRLIIVQKFWHDILTKIG